VILDADDRQGSALYWSERRDSDDVMVKDSSVAGLPLHVSRGRSSGKIDLIIIDTPANSKDIAMLAAEQADFVIIPVAPGGWTFIRCCRPSSRCSRRARRSPSY
jgi:chromosome partitioning protein